MGRPDGPATARRGLSSIAALLSIRLGDAAAEMQTPPPCKGPGKGRMAEEVSAPPPLGGFAKAERRYRVCVELISLKPRQRSTWDSWTSLVTNNGSQNTTYHQHPEDFIDYLPSYHPRVSLSTARIISLTIVAHMESAADEVLESSPATTSGRHALQIRQRLGPTTLVKCGDCGRVCQSSRHLMYASRFLSLLHC